MGGQVAGEELPPLARGKVMCLPATTKAEGITPLARGKVPVLGLVCGRHGITPARAGKSKLWNGIKEINRNYPRSRGEKQDSRTQIPAITELPPLARGKDAGRGNRLLDPGITPARAGKRCRL